MHFDSISNTNSAKLFGVAAITAAFGRCFPNRISRSYVRNDGFLCFCVCKKFMVLILLTAVIVIAARKSESSEFHEKKKPEQQKNDWKKILESITIAAIENDGACANERAWAHARLNHMRFESGNFRLFCISNNPCMWHVIHPNEQIAIYNVNETKYTNVHSFVFPSTVFCLVELYVCVCSLFKYILFDKFIEFNSQ